MAMDVATAKVYQEFFVPALFGPFADRVAEAAGIEAGSRVLDVGCGTGVLARAAAERAAPGGKVVGVDPSRGMLEVACRKGAGIAWCRGAAEALPFRGDAFDHVVSQFGLNFFADRVASLREMARVARPEGRLTVAVWGGLEHSPGYAALVDLLDRLFGDPVGDALRDPFALGARSELRRVFFAAGLHSVEISTLEGEARFPSIRKWIYTDIKGWSPVGGALNDEQFETLSKAAETELADFVTGDGTVAFPIAAHVATATPE